MKASDTIETIDFKTAHGILTCRIGLDGKMIAHIQKQGAFMESDGALMSDFIEQGDEVVDIGANVGGFTVRFAKKAGTVHAFEPIPETADQLEQNLVQNNIVNVVVHRVGLSSEPGVLYSHRTPDSGSTSLTTNKDLSDAPEEPVQVTTLDDVLGGHPIRFIKLDVEGMEVSVLKGARALIAQAQPVVFFEIQKDNMGAFGSTFSALAGFFSGYHFYFNLHTEQDGTYMLGRLPWLGFLRFASGTHNVLAVPVKYPRAFAYRNIVETVGILVARKIRNLLARARKRG